MRKKRLTLLREAQATGQPGVAPAPNLSPEGVAKGIAERREGLQRAREGLYVVGVEVTGGYTWLHQGVHVVNVES